MVAYLCFLANNNVVDILLTFYSVLNVRIPAYVDVFRMFSFLG